MSCVAVKSAVLTFVLVSIVAVPPVEAEPPRPEVTVAIGPAYAHLRGDRPGSWSTHERHYAAPALDVSLTVGARLSSTFGVHAVAFGDFGASACTNLVDLARDPDAPPRPPVCAREASLRGGGLGLGVSLAERRDGLFVAPSVWAGTLYVDPLWEGEFGVVHRDPELWYGAAVTIGWTRRVRAHLDVGAALTARLAVPTSDTGFHRARLGTISLLVGWR
jgi:hypothetical protein